MSADAMKISMDQLIQQGPSEDWEAQSSRPSGRKHVIGIPVGFKSLYIFVLHLIVSIQSLLLWRSYSIGDMTRVGPVEESSWSPARELLEYEVMDTPASGHVSGSKYWGPPDTEQDEAWDQLIRPVYFNATFQELGKAGESTQDAAELVGGGYLASLGVYHELHCVRQLRFHLYQDRYYSNLTEANMEYMYAHLDHCLETLRRTIMCHGNVGLYSFVWDDPAAWKPSLRSNSKSVCARWSSIENWAYSRKTALNPELRRIEPEATV